MGPNNTTRAAAGKKKGAAHGLTAFLREVPIFRELPPESLANVARILRRERYAKGRYLFREHEQGDTLYIVSSGLVRIEQASPSGRVKTLALFQPGSVFGEMAVLDQDTRSASAIAAEEAEIFVIGKQDFQEMLRQNPQMTMNILRVLCDRLRAANAQIQDLTFKSLPGRISSTIAKLAEKFGVAVADGVMINVRLTQQELADLVGTNRESVSKAISAYRKEGSVRVEDQKIVVTDRAKLLGWS
ncbi:MAG: Crp/Fnr family transcriptional regulator [Planctomycetes bacterium]|nr:Crp/Fnr family transcriptional regulator [Planctomycetota bacterium]